MELSEIIRRATKEYVIAELNLDAGKQRNVLAQDLKNLEQKVKYREAALQALKNSAALPALLDKLEKKDRVIKALCEDFTDFVTSGIHNAAPYCANRCQDCTDEYGWCKVDRKACRGFYPKDDVESED